MDDDVIDLLKAHEYFRGVSDAVLGEIARIGTITNYDAAAVVHQLNDPLSSICFILRGRLKTVRVDSRGDEQLFQIFERGDQYGMMLGGLGESIPLRIFALEPSTILSLDHEKSMELVLLHPDLRRQWLRSYARSLRRRFLEPDAGQAPKVLAMLHQSPATRNLAQKIIGRLQGLGEAVSVLSDADSWRSIPDVGFRSLLDGNRLIEVAEIRRQIAEWNQAKRIVVDITAAQNLDWAVLLRPADCALVFIRPREIGPAIERLRALDLASRGWRDKIAIVWLLEEGSSGGARGTGTPRLREPGIQNLRIAAAASLGQGAFHRHGARGPLPAGCQDRRGPGWRGCPRHGAPGCAQRPRSEWHRRRCDRRHERRGHDRGPVFRGSGLRIC